MRIGWLVCLLFVGACEDEKKSVPAAAAKVEFTLFAEKLPDLEATDASKLTITMAPQRYPTLREVGAFEVNRAALSEALPLLRQAALARGCDGLRINHSTTHATFATCAVSRSKLREEHDLQSLLGRRSSAASKWDVEKVANNHFRIKWDDFANAVKTPRVVRWVPVRKSATVVGVRMYSIRPSSVMASLGFRNGDTIETINGAVVGLTRLETLLKKKENKKVFSMIRRKVPMTLTVEFR